MIQIRIRKIFRVLGVMAILTACQPSGFPPMGTAPATIPQSGNISSATAGLGGSGLMIVDCLLPGQIRKIGRMVYQSPRRPTRITANQCEILGGEYVAYDRADYQTALRVWEAQAVTGDQQAQTYVGEIFEKGLGTAPDYTQAAQWYHKAAAQGYSRAQINLGHLYEKGLGVPQDMETALQWYRKGAGLSESLAIQGFGPVEDSNQTIKQLNDEIQQLEQQLRKAEENLDANPDSQPSTQQLLDRIQELETQLSQYQSREATTERVKLPKLPAMDQGGYFALIIGNATYQDAANFKPLVTPKNDMVQLKKILMERYQFEETAIQALPDATHDDIFNALASFNQTLLPKDKFLLYFAGHGIYDAINSRGHWLPVDAVKANRGKWISNEQITDYLNEIQAQHVLVIADSCYSGSMTDSAILHPRPGMPEAVLREIMANLVRKRSRTVLTSGGLTPVFDTGGGGNSIFAEALLQVLNENQGVLVGKELFAEVSPRVSLKIRQVFGKRQEPGYGALLGAGHGTGDFFFVTQSSLAKK